MYRHIIGGMNMSKVKFIRLHALQPEHVSSGLRRRLAAMLGPSTLSMFGMTEAELAEANKQRAFWRACVDNMSDAQVLEVFNEGD